ncbi:MAG TPA: EAL domain-containing protein [Pyrinomonadaceae bacterium]|nr:EAL domain-containing protein [Pyrinomonadaceae bacterium]
MTNEGEITILVADDNPDRLELMCVLLRKAGYQVFAASDGREAFEVACRERPLLVISDVMMPHVDGIQLCRMLRAHPELSITRTLLVSAMRVDDSSAVEGLEAGADDYLEAPYDPMRLIAKVARLAERARFEAALRESEERYALAAQGANDGLWDWNLRTGEVYFSARWKAMLGWAEDEVGASVEEWFGRVHPEDVEALRESIHAHVAGHSAHLELEHRMRHRDGTYRWMLSRGIVVRDAEGRAARMAGSQSDINERKRIEEQLLHDAFHDALTGLPNRALFTDRLGQAVERSRRHEDYHFAVIFLDLDRFKTVNDSLGHTVGDHLLIEVSRRLESCTRGEDTAARIGGDEFTILLEDVKDPADVLRTAERIQVCLARPFDLCGHEVFTSASLGIALSASHYERPEDILRAANTAMHKAKALGKGRHQVFDAAMHSDAVSFLRIETDMQRAAEREEFRVQYQPIISLETGRAIGFEALVRWQHPERGLIYPKEFISVAEETGMISRIDRWVLREACRQTARWHGCWSQRPSISVNLSAKSFLQPDLVEYVRQVLEETRLSPGCLKLEITESVLMSDISSVNSLITRLRALGVGLYLDDFGTGYSSLSYLHRFPLTALKIDRSFISRIALGGEHVEIARAIVTLAHSLSLEAISEGIEEEEQLVELRSLGCEYGQGHLFAKPLDSAQAEALIKGSPGASFVPRREAGLGAA